MSNSLPLAIEVHDFRKTFFLGLRRKRFEAALGIGFEVQQGEIFGFLGPNGAGKTTTIKALLGLIRPDAGKLRVLGHTAESGAWRAHVGYLPENPNFYEYLTGFELVTWFARLAGLSAERARSEATRQLERVKLTHAMHRRLRGYSKGMLQRAGLAQAMVGEPRLLILDEPMTGLDPIGRKDVRELLLELKAEGRTIFYSTHILPDVEMTCDRVAIVHRGKIQRAGRLEEILGEHARSVTVRFSNLAPDAIEKLASGSLVVRRSEGQVEFDVADAEAARRLIAASNALGGVLMGMMPNREDLESLFVRTLGVDASTSRDERHP